MIEIIEQSADNKLWRKYDYKNTAINEDSKKQAV